MRSSSTSILVVCTGNVCRSPIAEASLRSMLIERFGDRAPVVSSAGTAGWEGSPAFGCSAEAAAEHGVDVSHHVARNLSRQMVEDADLVLCMAAEHRDDVISTATDRAAARAFTLKELVRLLEQLPPVTGGGEPASLATRITEAAARRTAYNNALNEDVLDPYGDSAAAHQAIVREIQEWSRRLVIGLYGTESPVLEEASSDT